MNNLQQTLTCLIRLRYAIERMSSKRLFPYPATTLVEVMKYIESVYDGEGRDKLCFIPIVCRLSNDVTMDPT